MVLSIEFVSESEFLARDSCNLDRKIDTLVSLSYAYNGWMLRMHI